MRKMSHNCILLILETNRQNDWVMGMKYALAMHAA